MMLASSLRTVIPAPVRATADCEAVTCRGIGLPDGPVAPKQHAAYFIFVLRTTSSRRHN